MAENRFVLDTNAVIALAAGDNATISVLENKLKAADLFISVISEIELFSRPKMAADEEENLRAFLAERTIIIDITEDVKNETIALRRSVKLRLPDCIVAATAVVLDSVLLTADKELLRLDWSDLKTENIF
jgi:predicted nucleic acid-binding protein